MHSAELTGRPIVVVGTVRSSARELILRVRDRAHLHYAHARKFWDTPLANPGYAQWVSGTAHTQCYMYTASMFKLRLGSHLSPPNFLVADRETNRYTPLEILDTLRVVRYGFFQYWFCSTLLLHRGCYSSRQ